MTDQKEGGVSPIATERRVGNAGERGLSGAVCLRTAADTGHLLMTSLRDRRYF